MSDFAIRLHQADYEEHTEIGASWMRGLILGVLLGMLLIAAGIVLSLSSLQNSASLSMDCFIVGIPLLVVCLVVLTVWKLCFGTREDK